MTTNYHHLPPPESDQQDVLLHLIKHGEVSCMNFPMLAGYRTRVSELRRLGVQFIESDIVGKNRHGHAKTIKSHRVTNPHFAVRLYNELKTKQK